MRHYLFMFGLYDSMFVQETGNGSSKFFIRYIILNGAFSAGPYFIRFMAWTMKAVPTHVRQFSDKLSPPSFIVYENPACTKYPSKRDLSTYNLRMS